MSKKIIYTGLGLVLLIALTFSIRHFWSNSVPMPSGKGVNPNADIVAVIGATGRTGKQIARHILQAKQYRLRAVVRDIDKARDLWDEGVEIVQADVTDSKAINQALKGVKGVIIASGPGGNFKGLNSPEAVDYQGVKNIAQAAKDNNVAHVVMISSWGATHIDNPINKNLHNVLIWKYLAEAELRSSKVTYTIVRPGSLQDTAGGQLGIEFGQGDKFTAAPMSREDVAKVCVQALFNPSAYRKTFEIINTKAPAPVIWESVFSNLVQDTD